MKTVVLKGYYGRDNFGDEIMLDLIVSFFKQYYPAINLVVMNSNPQMLLDKYGIKTPEALVTGKSGKTNLFKRVKRVVQSDIYIVGGGTIITDKHSSLHLIEYLIEFVLRRLLGKPNVLFSVGATKLYKKSSYFICKWLLNKCDVCLARDIESYSLLTQFSNKANIVKTGDLVLLAFNLQDFRNKSLIKSELKFDSKIGFCLMPYYESLYKRPDLDEAIAAGLASVINRLSAVGHHISLIPIQYGDNNILDFQFSQHVKDLCNKSVELVDCKDNTKKMNKMAEMDCIVSMRLHSLLYAISRNIPVVAVNHNEKIDACLKLYGISEQSVDLDHICDIFDKVILAKSLGSEVYNTLAKEQICAKKNFEYLKKIVDKVLENG